MSEQTAQRRHYLEHFDRLSQQSNFPPDYFEIICELAGWCQWLFDKLEKMVELPDQELREQTQLLGPRLDFYLYADPLELRQRLEEKRWSAPGIKKFLETLAEAQTELRLRFQARGLERIEAEPGRAFQPGIVNRKDGSAEPSPDPNLHDRICRLEAGDGGYRLAGQVLFPSRAVRFEHSPA